MAEPARRIEPQSGTGSAAKPTPVILLVDDDEITRTGMAGRLKRLGYRVIEAGDGTAGLTAIRAQRPDLVILDLGLPDMDGFTVVEQMRARGFGLPVLFLTARDNVTDRVRGLKAGGDDYVTKPFAVEELMVLNERTAALPEILRRTGLLPEEFTDEDLEVLKVASPSLQRWVLAESAEVRAIRAAEARRRREVMLAVVGVCVVVLAFWGIRKRRKRLERR